MTNPRTTALLDALEARAEQGAASLLGARETIAELQARIRQLEKENSRLREQLEAKPAVSPTRSQGFAALMGRRPKPTPSLPPEALSDNDSVAQEETGGAQAVANKATTPAADAPEESPVESRLPSDEQPSPQALLDHWYQRYTHTFFKGHTRPLKVGIHDDLMAREPWPEKLVRRALACYVHLPRYLKAVRAGTERVDLEGANAGVVNEEEARYAKRQLEELRARNRSRQQKRTQAKEKQREQAARTERLDRKLSELLAKHER